MKSLLQKILARAARIVLARYRPIVIGITGNVGKTSTREAVFSVLRKKYRVRRAEKNYNTEIGVPITILGIPHHGSNILGWAFSALKALIQRDSHYPEILILEMAADHPGDIGYLTKLAPPLIGVITAIGEIPVHVEFFSGPKELAFEKAKLIEVLPQKGYAILNADDEVVSELRSRTKARIISFGFLPSADLKITNYELRIKEVDGKKTSDGMSFKIDYKGTVAPIRLFDVFGRHQAYAVTTAAAVGLALNMNLVEIADALKEYRTLPGRLVLLKGNKDTLILDDTYNASPMATEAALEVLKEIPAQRRIAVLGDMLELGAFTEEAHIRIGKEAAQVSNIFIGVGERMKFAFHKLGAPSQMLVFWYSTPEEAGRKLEEVMRPGDVILVKGSQSMRMEKVVKEIMAEPERAEKLLARQSVDWLRR